MRKTFNQVVSKSKEWAKALFSPTPLASTSIWKNSTAPWEVLNKDCWGHICSYLSLSDVLNLSLTSKTLLTICNSLSLWNILYLSHFGDDYWSLNAPIHPYTVLLTNIKCLLTGIHQLEKLGPETNKWTNIDPTKLDETFTSLKLDHKKEVAFNLFEIAKHASFKDLYRENYELVSTWRQDYDTAIIVVGLAGSGKSSIMQHLKHTKFAKFEKHLTPSYHAPVSMMILAPQPKADRNILNNGKTIICEVRKLRHWYPRYRGNRSAYQHLCFVIDCEKMSSAEYRKEVYTEFHGTLGEAKESLYTAVVVFFTKLDKEGSMSMEECCKYLKFFPVDVDVTYRNCPYYAGPVTILCSQIEHADSPKTNSNIEAAFHWLLMQPSARPHWFGIHTQATGLVLCTLIEENIKYGMATTRIEYRSWW